MGLQIFRKMALLAIVASGSLSAVAAAGSQETAERWTLLIGISEYHVAAKVRASRVWGWACGLPEGGKSAPFRTKLVYYLPKATDIVRAED